MLNIETIMRTSPVIPVIVIDDMADAVPLAKALVAGRLRVLEVTLRTEHGLAAIGAIKAAVPDAIVGAGTVLSAADVRNAKAAGAEFLVSPGNTPSLISAVAAENMLLLPGVSSPSEVMLLLEHGIRHMKFFPAVAAGGVAMLKSIAGPLPQVQFCPTGGINLNNAGDFLALPNVLCIGGSWMLAAADIRNKNWAEIEAQARIASQLSCGG